MLQCYFTLRLENNDDYLLRAVFMVRGYVLLRGPSEFIAQSRSIINNLDYFSIPNKYEAKLVIIPICLHYCIGVVTSQYMYKSVQTSLSRMELVSSQETCHS